MKHKSKSEGIAQSLAYIYIAHNRFFKLAKCLADEEYSQKSKDSTNTMVFVV
jgi:hypothetical protein